MNFGTFLRIRLYSKYQIILNRNKSFSGNDSGLFRGDDSSNMIQVQYFS